VTVHDVVVGEVWLCSGQSNMEFTLDFRDGWQTNTRTRVAHAEQEIAAANFPLIRQLKVHPVVAETPADDFKTDGWEPASPQTAGRFTAVGYFFARDIHQKLGVPVGIINSTLGATPIEAWMSPAALASDPTFKVADERWQQMLAEYPALKAAHDLALAEWTKADADAREQGDTAHAAFLAKNRKPRAPRGPGNPWTPRGLFNGMINPLLPCAIRGVLWYQGETNAERHPSEYHALFATMITTWRAHFGQGDLPFYWVQLQGFKASFDPTGLNYALMREAQTETLILPNTGQALAIDIGEPDNIHPINKQEVGRRLALLAKNRIYGLATDDTGPTFAGAVREGAAMRVRFTHAGSGLVAHEKPVQSLEIAGADRRFFPANGRVERDTLVVAAPEVKEPVAVRYAWRNFPEANLYSGTGLPAVPFRSDDW
jgi:sialate O-acetylesterase